jgi:hypothetical protein
MNSPYSVSHIYDESGSAKARHYEFVKAAQARHLVDGFKNNKQGRISRARSGFDGALVALSGKLRVSWGRGMDAATLND